MGSFIDFIALRGVQDLEPGLGISRLDRNDFLRFMQLATFCSSYMRLKEVRPRPPAQPCSMAVMYANIMFD